MGGMAIVPQILQRLFQGQQNPLYPQQPQGAPADFGGPVLPNPDNVQPRADTDPGPPTKLFGGATLQTPNATQAPSMDVSNPPKNQMEPAPMQPASATDTPRGAISSAMKPPLSEQDFAGANPNASTAFMPARPVGDFDSGQHPALRHALASLFAGMAEFGRPGTGAAMAERWNDQASAQRQFDNPENQAKMKAGALNQAYQSYLQHQQEIQKTQHDRYVTPRSGGVFDTESGGYADGAAPPEKPEQPHTVETGSGIFQWNPQTNRYDIPVGPPKADAKPPSFEEQSYQEWKQTHPKGTRLQYDAEHSRATQKPEKEPKGESFIGTDGKVIEVKPGMTLPAGAKPLSKAGEPTADEQRRADLAGNLNENLNQLEDIVSRRPELFGPLAGRWSELKSKFGSDDPDIAALSVLEHQIGMAQISAHGMRSAHGIEGAAASIINGLHSGPAALKGAIATVRKSVGTFQQDVETAKGGPTKPSAKAPAQNQTSAEQTATGPNGHKIALRGGRWVDATTGQPIQ